MTLRCPVEARLARVTRPGALLTEGGASVVVKVGRVGSDVGRWISYALLLLGAGGSALTSFPVRAARERIAGEAAAPGGGSRAERKEFESLVEQSQQAGDAGDWDGFLDASELALTRLPETDANHGARAGVMGDVGSWRLEKRSGEQLRRTIRILEAYLAGLQKSYGDDADQRAAAVAARGYIDELRGRLPPGSEGTELPPPPAPPAPAHEQEDHPTARPSRPVAMLAAGGVLTVGGAAMLITGLAFVPRWIAAADEYNAQNFGACGVPCPPDTIQREEDLSDRVRTQRARTLGLVLPAAFLVGGGIALLVLGVRARKRTHENSRDRVAMTTRASWSGLAVSF